MSEKTGHKDKVVKGDMMSKKFFIYIVGRSGSGKTTISNALDAELKKVGVEHLQVIDGDVIREQFGGIFGYTYEERMRCNQAVRVVVQYLLDNDISVVLSQVAAYESMRQIVREQFKDDYIEVYVKCSYEESVKRDVKGYYKKQKEGKMSNLNGANDTFEIPQNSDIVIDTEQESVAEAVNKILAYLREQRYVI